MAIQEAPYQVYAVQVVPMHKLTEFVFKGIVRILDGICALDELVRPLHSCRIKDSQISRF